MFDQLVYTDCRVGQGLGGGGGLQFQACTEGLPGDVLRAASPGALYKVYEPWMLTSPPTPVDRYPGYSVHLPTGDGRWYTGKGRYLGRAVASAREGNHLTHVLTTTLPQDYTHFRPVEVCTLPLWRETPAPERCMAAVELCYDEAPLGIEAAAEVIRRSPRGPEHLAAVVSAMEDPDMRVAIRSDSEQEVLAWVLAITAQFPINHALEIGFEAFVSDPYASSARLVGVYGPWSEPFARRRLPKTCALDLVEGTINVDARDPEVAWAVARWCDGQAEDVDEALDLLDAWGIPMSPAARVAVNTVGLGRPLETTVAVEKYLAFLGKLAPETLRNNQRSLADPLLAVRTAETSPAAMLQGLELLVAGGVTPTTDALMASVIQEWSWSAESGRGWPGTSLPRGFSWSTGRLPEHIGAGLVSLLAKVDQATQLSVLAWLTRSGIALSVPPTVLSALAAWWFQDPSRGTALVPVPGYYQTIRDCLLDEHLGPALDRADAQECLRLGKAWHPVLADVAIRSFETPLERCLAPYRYRDGSPAVRQDLIDLLARSMSWLRRNGTGWTWFFAVSTDAGDLARLLTMTAHQADAELLHYADEVLDATLRSALKRGVQPLAEALLASGNVGLSPDSAAFVTRVRDAQWAMRVLTSGTPENKLDAAYQTFVSESQERPSALPEGTRPALYLWQRNPELASRYLSTAGDDEFGGLLGFLEQEWRHRDPHRRHQAFLRSLSALHARDFQRDRAATLRTALGAAVRGLSDDQYQEVREAVFSAGGSQGDEWLTLWDQLVRATGASRRIPCRASGGRGEDRSRTADASEGRWWNRRK